MSNVSNIRFELTATVEQEIERETGITKEDLIEGLQSGRYTTELLGNDANEAAYVRDVKTQLVVGEVVDQKFIEPAFDAFEEVEIITEEEEGV